VCAPLVLLLSFGRCTRADAFLQMQLTVLQDCDDLSDEDCLQKISASLKSRNIGFPEDLRASVYALLKDYRRRCESLRACIPLAPDKGAKALAQIGKIRLGFESKIEAVISARQTQMAENHSKEWLEKARPDGLVCGWVNLCSLISRIKG
jgi:hypothetical protein